MIHLKTIAATTALAALFLTSGCREKKNPTICPVCGIKATFTHASAAGTVYGHYVNPQYNTTHTWMGSP
jgi:hypothetical protein